MITDKVFGGGKIDGIQGGALCVLLTIIIRLYVVAFRVARELRGTWRSCRESRILYTVNVVFWKHLQLPIHYHNFSMNAQ